MYRINNLSKLIFRLRECVDITINSFTNKNNGMKLRINHLIWLRSTNLLKLLLSCNYSFIQLSFQKMYVIFWHHMRSNMILTFIYCLASFIYLINESIVLNPCMLWIHFVMLWSNHITSWGRETYVRQNVCRWKYRIFKEQKIFKEIHTFPWIINIAHFKFQKKW